MAGRQRQLDRAELGQIHIEGDKAANALGIEILIADDAGLRSEGKAIAVETDPGPGPIAIEGRRVIALQTEVIGELFFGFDARTDLEAPRSEEHTSELQSLRHL